MGTGFLFKRPPPPPFELNIDEFQKRLNDYPPPPHNQYQPPPAAGSNMTPAKQRVVASAGSGKSNDKERLGFSHFFAGVWLIGVLFTWAVYGWGWALLVFFLPGILFAMAMDTD